MQNDLLTELGRSLLSSSLDDERLMTQTGEQPAVQILPEANVIKIGGQSIIDRGFAEGWVAPHPPSRECTRASALATAGSARST